MEVTAKWSDTKLGWVLVNVFNSHFIFISGVSVFLASRSDSWKALRGLVPYFLKLSTAGASSKLLSVKGFSSWRPC